RHAVRARGTGQSSVNGAPNAERGERAHGPAERWLGGEDWTAVALFALTILLILGSRWISPSFGSWNQAKAILVLSCFTIVVGFGITRGAPRGHASPALSTLLTSRVLGVPPVILLMLALTVVGTVLQRRTAFGRRVYAVGTNPNAAYIAGLPVQAVTILCYTI